MAFDDKEKHVEQLGNAVKVFYISERFKQIENKLDNRHICGKKKFIGV